MRALKKAIALVAIAATTVGGYQGYKTYNKPMESTMLMQNVEALANGAEGSSGMVVAHWCSKKNGNIFCSKTRGNRKWVKEIIFTIGYSPTICTDCDDDDYELVID